MTNAPGAVHDVRVVRFHSGSGAMSDGHVHRKCIPFAIIVQPTVGSYVITGPDAAIRVARGEVALVAADVPVAFAHHAGADGRMEARWLHVQASYREVLDPCALQRTPHRIAGAAAARIGELLGELASTPWDTVPRRLLHLGLASRALGLALAGAPAHPRAAALLGAAARLGPLTAWLRDHLRGDLDVDAIAAAAGLSRSRLHALFQDHLGRSPMAHLKELRLEAAARLLLTSADPVAAIASAVGFANAFHFSREFSRRYGMPPRRYRDEQRLSWGAQLPA